MGPLWPITQLDVTQALGASFGYKRWLVGTMSPQLFGDLISITLLYVCILVFGLHTTPQITWDKLF